MPATVACQLTGKGCQVHAHTADVNVISWNRLVSYLVVSGCDDGSFRYGGLSLHFLSRCLSRASAVGMSGCEDVSFRLVCLWLVLLWCAHSLD